YYFKDDQHLKKYCDNENCGSDLEKVNAGCLYLLYTFFGSSDMFKSVAKSNIDIVEYIMIWLVYMLNLKKQENKTNLQYFYDTYINNDKYKKPITGVMEYNSYKDLIDQKTYFMTIDINDIFKFYDAFILLCEMYTGFDTKPSNCTKCSDKASQFVKKYKELKENSNITENSPYYKLLSTLSTDYDNFKNYCNSKGVNCKDFPLLPEIITKVSAQISEYTSSSSSIKSKLIPFLSIFGAIAFFLGFSYKYSLFGFRKRSKKQHLREKLKK
ncbi:BIR protein, partial [Plasmodium berghei]